MVTWNQFVKDIREKRKVSHKEAMKIASPLWAAQKGPTKKRNNPKRKSKHPRKSPSSPNPKRKHRVPARLSQKQPPKALPIWAVPSLTHLFGKDKEPNGGTSKNGTVSSSIVPTNSPPVEVKYEIQTHYQENDSASPPTIFKMVG